MCKKVVFVLVIVIACILTGCSKKGNVSGINDTTSTSSSSDTLEASYALEYNTPSAVVDDSAVFKIDNTTPYQKLITKKVDIHTFAQRYSPNGKRNVDDVMETIGIECLRKTDEGALYSVHEVLQGGLLYVFYTNHDWDTDVAGNSIIRWFYVRDRLSSSDFQALTEKKYTIDDVIRINKTEQIFLNIYRADPEFWGKGILYTTHYLEDGILDIAYELIDGKLVLSAKTLTEDFNLPDLDEPVYYPYNARILDTDWVK